MSLTHSELTHSKLSMKEIRKIIADYDALDHSKEKVALASVVNVEASSYRRIGARMLVRSSGIWTGGISGGCLEGDALKRSQMAIFKNTASKVVYDTMDDDQNQIGVGLGCNGRIEVLFTPIDPTDADNEIEQLRKIAGLDAPSIMVKIIDAEGNEDLLGKSILVENDLENIDFQGIAKEELKQWISETTANRKPRIVECTTNSGAKLKLLIEYIRPETRLVIVGYNYDVNAFAGIANELGWEIHVVGRTKKLSKSLFNLAAQTLEFEQAEQVEVHDYTAVVLMSHDYNWDKELLPIFLEKNPAYIGMLGPKKRMQKMQAELPDDDLESLVNFHSPTGLDIGAESPEEIALSIASEIIATFRGRDGASLKFRKGTIHV